MEEEEERKPARQLIHQDPCQDLTFPSVSRSCPHLGLLFRFPAEVSLGVKIV